MKPKHSENMDLCYMDTDSFIYNIRTGDFYKDNRADLQEKLGILENKKGNFSQ